MANNKGNQYQQDILNLILNGVAIANIADNAAAAPLANLYVALHTADPTNAGNQSSSEISYTGYARVAVARNPASPAWTVAGNNPATAHPSTQINFPTSTGGTGGTATFFSVGTDASGIGRILYSGPISPAIVVNNGTTPQLGTNTAITEN